MFSLTEAPKRARVWGSRHSTAALHFNPPVSLPLLPFSLSVCLSVLPSGQIAQPNTLCIFSYTHTHHEGCSPSTPSQHNPRRAAARISPLISVTESLKAKLLDSPVQFGYWSFTFIMCPGYPLWWQVGNVSLWWKADNKKRTVCTCVPVQPPCWIMTVSILYGHAVVGGKGERERIRAEEKGGGEQCLFSLCPSSSTQSVFKMNFPLLHHLQVLKWIVSILGHLEQKLLSCSKTVVSPQLGK